MWVPASHHRRGVDASRALFEAFLNYERAFQEITGRAKLRFERRDWLGMHHDAIERLELYPRVIATAVAEIRQQLDASEKDRKLWAIMKGAYSDLIRRSGNLELAETFFNSITRRIFTTIGVDARIEFLFSDFDSPIDRGPLVYRSFQPVDDLAGLMRQILASCNFDASWTDIDRDAQRVAAAIKQQQQTAQIAGPPTFLELIDSIFYRNQAAFLVGRLHFADQIMPLCLAIHHENAGVEVDAALLNSHEIGIVFSFTRSYFHVEVHRPRDLVEFLKSIMPHKPIAELYNAIGHNKHGKTELFRDLVRHIEGSTDLFDIAPGDRGMVMSVFTLPSFDVVFKIIRDRFAYPKSSTRREVMDRYELVFRHDRAGRLVDVQEFEHLAFPRDRFTERLLNELASETAETVDVGRTHVEIKHAYVERRVVPLNLFIREAPMAATRNAVIDYGQAVRDLAATNIFPGDMLLKNFGVTRQGRVVFYDYDELCLVTECNFREMPAASDDSEEFGAEPWFYVGPQDIFPEEFLQFMGLGIELRQAFLSAHEPLLTARFWNQLKARLQAGEMLDILPYPCSRRLTSQ